MVPPAIVKSQRIQPADLVCPPGELTMFIGRDHHLDLLPMEEFKDPASRIVVYKSRATQNHLLVGAINTLAPSLNKGETVHQVRP